MNPERVSVGEEGEGHSMLMDRKQKRHRNNSGESGVRNLEAESIRSKMERTGEKLKTITEIRRNNAHDTFIAENVYLVLNSLLDWEPGEKLKQRCDVISLKKKSVCSEPAQSCM